MARNFRDVFRFITPAWLNDGSDGSRVLFSLSLLIDASVERFQQALLSRFPTFASDTTLGLLGGDRGIPRAPGESRAAYAGRLIAWRYPRGHRTRGSDYSLHAQLRALFLGAVGVTTVDARGTRCTTTTAGVETCERNTGWGWDLRPASEWSRFWLILQGLEHNYEIGDPRLGVSPAPALQTIGIRGISPEYIRTIRQQILGGDHPWRPAGTQPEWLIVDPSGATVTAGTSWWRWHSYVLTAAGERAFPSRSSAFAYVPLRTEYESYAGDADHYYVDLTRDGNKPLLILTADAESAPDFAGNAERWPPSFANGATGVVAGNPSSFPASIPMPHDGTELV